MNTNPFLEYSDGDELKSPKERRYFWLKLKDGFFEDRHIKILKAQTNGHRIILVFLALQLKALKNDGIIEYEKLLPSLTAELAIEIDEAEDTVAEALEALTKFGLVEILEDGTVYFTAKREIIDYGSEGASAERARRCRARKKAATQCNG